MQYKFCQLCGKEFWKNNKVPLSADLRFCNDCASSTCDNSLPRTEVLYNTLKPDGSIKNNEKQVDKGNKIVNFIKSLISKKL